MIAKKGDSIFDSHLGSGSIALACHDLGFDLEACELDKDYFVISEYKSGNVKSPSNYLKACLNKKVESQGIENLTTPFYWQQIFRYFNSFHFDKGNVVCTKSGVTLAHQMSANQDRVFLYLSTVFREVKKGNEEKQKELIEIFKAIGKFGLTVQEFKEIVSFNSATKENKEELIKIFREVI